MQRKIIKNNSKMACSKKKVKQINHELLKIYGQHKRQPASTKDASKTNKKIKEHEHERKSTQTYQFPQFSMSFLESENQNKPLSNRISKRREPSLKVIQENQIKQTDSTDYADLVLALSKVFKKLDIFNRGTINQKNISERPSSQYNFDFLIKVFQKIREQKLILTQREFVKLCESFVKQSKINEIRGFLKVFINQQTTLKQSININNQLNITYSPIEKRMALQKGKLSQVLSNIKNSNLQKLLETICKKEKKFTYMIQSVKQRKKITNSNNILKEINSNQTFCHDFSSNKSNNQESDKKKDANKTIEIKIADFQDNYDLKKQKLAYKQDFTPTFTFHLPQNNQRKSISQSTKQFQRQTNCINSQFIPNKHYGRWQQSTRLLHKSQFDFSIDIKSSTMRIQNTHEKCKIDELNNKLDEYLQRSKSKIEKSKIFLMENSGLIL